MPKRRKLGVARLVVLQSVLAEKAEVGQALVHIVVAEAEKIRTVDERH